MPHCLAVLTEEIYKEKWYKCVEKRNTSKSGDLVCAHAVLSTREKAEQYVQAECWMLKNLPYKKQRTLDKSKHIAARNLIRANI